MKKKMEEPLKNKWSTPVFVVAFVLLFLVVAALAFFFYSQYSKTKELLNQKDAAVKEAKSLVEEVAKLAVLPSKEQPTIATVQDKTKLKNQTFFAQAENGDKVLIYTAAKKAILYRPSVKRIVEFGPINIVASNQENNSSVQASSSAAVSPPPATQSVKVAVYNGTKVPGLAAATEATLKEKIPSVQVVEKSNTKNDYSKTLVIDLTGLNKLSATQIAGALNGEVASFPQGEVKPATDILVIVGQ